MAHEIATAADGRASIAYVGNTPWHGLGQNLTVGAPLDEWQREAGLDWEAKLAVVKYDRGIIDVDGTERPLLTQKTDSRVIYRSDTGDALSVVSDRYRPVQPQQVLEFYRDLTEKWGFQLETAGALKGGRKIWALAKTDLATQLRGQDRVNGYLLLATSFDGTMATQARFTGIRVVCNNTLSIASGEGKADVTVPHSTNFDADKVKTTLQIGDAWDAFARDAASMSDRIVSRDESVRFLLDVYHNLATPEAIKQAHADEKQAATIEKTMTRLSNTLFDAPGARMASSNGTLWGLVNAVTFDVDHAKPARSQENRLNAAWFGNGDVLKRNAWAAAQRVLQAA